MAYILFSGVGASDPVRGEHDGAMLHIVRHYKPTDVYLFITAKMKQQDENDDRYNKAIKSLEKSIGYCPSINKRYSEIVDADDFDAFMDPFKEILDEIVCNHPGDRILLNLSSGTPQMKSTMCFLAMDDRYPVSGIQVRNWEHGPSQSQSTTSEGYDVDREVERNKDNESGSANRCVEPKTLVFHRERTKGQLTSLISQYNYKAAVELTKEHADKTLQALLAHAEARQELKEQKAREEARRVIKYLQIDESKLYPIRDETSKCYELMEYFLILQNYQRTERYTEMVVRMNPFVIALQEEYLNLIPGFSVEGFYDEYKDFCVVNNDGRFRSSIKQVNNIDEKLLKDIVSKIGTIKNFYPSMRVCNLILQYFADNKRLKKMTKKDILLFNVCECINQRFRNEAAHKLKCVTRGAINEAIASYLYYNMAAEKKMNVETIIKRFKELLKNLYGEKCPEESFKVYDTINELIKKRL